jgi:hypothetical protein
MNDTLIAQTEMPNTQELCINFSLYQKIDISMHHPSKIAAWEQRAETIDAYCIDCDAPSVFRKLVRGIGTPGARVPFIASDLPPKSRKEKDTSEPIHQDQDLTMEFACSRNESHRMKFYFKIHDSSLFKVGQYPSVADLCLPSLGKYKKVLENQEYLELKKAVGLHAHDIGIGAFVYLRRIFENLIEKAHEKASGLSGWNEDAYQHNRIPDRIVMLKAYLPEILVNNAGIYAILSKGIHSLSDDECKEYFNTVKSGILLILDEEIKRREKEITEREMNQEINRIHSKLR